jgi:hypothetical protein
MSKNKLAKILSPLIVVPLSYIGLVIVNDGSHPAADELFETILFIAVISLSVGYAGLFCIVLPVEEALRKINCLSAINLITIGSISGGILFIALDYSFVPGHGQQGLEGILIVFPMGFILGLAVTLSYSVLSGIISKSALPLISIAIIIFFFLLFISPTLITNANYAFTQRAIKKIVSNANITELTFESCNLGHCSFFYEKLNETVTFTIYGSDNQKSKTELTTLIFSTWPKGASHCKNLYKGKGGFSSECSIF